MIMSDPRGGTGIGTVCPTWADARPAAVVNVEIPFLVFLGWVCMTAGFLLQLISVPSAKTISEIRAELKKAQLEQRHKVPH
jgi:hypothetical protein